MSFHNPPLMDAYAFTIYTKRIRLKKPNLRKIKFRFMRFNVLERHDISKLIKLDLHEEKNFRKLIAHHLFCQNIIKLVDVFYSWFKRHGFMHTKE